MEPTDRQAEADLAAEDVPGGTDVRAKKETGIRSMDILIFVGLLVGWIVLQVWLLPKLGVPT